MPLSEARVPPPLDRFPVERGDVWSGERLCMEWREVMYGVERGDVWSGER